MIFNVDPNTKPRMTRSDKWKTNPDHLNPKARQRKPVTKYLHFKDCLQFEAEKFCYTVTEELSVVFYIPMSKSWTMKKKAEMEGKPHQYTPDIDNLLKAFLDALCTEDNYVHSVKAQKIWAYEGSIEIKEYI